MSWEAVKACYAEMMREAERLKAIMAEPDDAARAHEKPAPPRAVAKPIAVTRATKVAFTQVRSLLRGVFRGAA